MPETTSVVPGFGLPWLLNKLVFRALSLMKNHCLFGVANKGEPAVAGIF